MTSREIGILNSMITFAAENIPGGLSTEEHEVAFQVATWVQDGVPVRQICPHCGAPAPRGEGRLVWLETHIDGTFHRWAWHVKNTLNRVTYRRVL
jgi:hypothetical protein